MTMGIFILGFVPVGYFIMEAFFQTLVKAKLRQNFKRECSILIGSLRQYHFEIHKAKFDSTMDQSYYFNCTWYVSNID